MDKCQRRCNDCNTLKNGSFCDECKKDTGSAISLCVTDELLVRDSFKLKKYLSGVKKWAVEVIGGWWPSSRYKEGVDHSRVIDKEKNEYHEVVKEFQTGEIVHECHEPLTDHQGHGDAKKKNLETKQSNEAFIKSIPQEWEFADKFVVALKNFLEAEEFLLVKDLNERTITHKLAEYLSAIFKKPDFDVDCEYNRMERVTGDQMEYITKTLDLNIETIESDSVNGSTVFPDIAVHKRGNNQNNYFLIEFKKKGYAVQKREDGVTQRDFDKKKLCAYTTQLAYHWGIYLEMDGIRIAELEFYRKGKRYE